MDSKRPTLDDYARQYFETVAPDTVVHSTLLGYRSIYNAHWKRFGHRKITAIKPSELKIYLASTGLKKKTRRHILSVLRLIFDEAVADGLLFPNPLANWKMRKDRETEFYEADPYTLEERDALLDWLETREPIAWRYFLHGFYSGMRTGELLGFPWKNYEPPFATIDQEVVRRDIRLYGKTDKRRKLLVPQRLQDMLADCPTRGESAFVHVNTKGTMLRDADYLMKWWRKAHAALRIRRRKVPYPWRATFVSQCMSSGIGIEDVARWIGNSPQMIRAHYHKYLPDDGRELELLEQIEKATQGSGIVE
ncbi:MAG: hypothetical protein HOE54_05835 [Gammaproteobacteria bacterium]|jgi:integrase|nr:hypothetical protein [Gammaproteobacteria bacterium]MBT7371645.1 hypothetical protein [Gammaproteobacteria bacterium]